MKFCKLHVNSLTMKSIKYIFTLHVNSLTMKFIKYSYIINVNSLTMICTIIHDHSLTMKFNYEVHQNIFKLHLTLTI